MRKHFHSNRYRLLLYSTISLFVTSSIFQGFQILRVINGLILGVVLFATIKTFLDKKKTFYLYLCLNFLAVFTNIVSLYIVNDAIRIALEAFSGIITFSILYLAVYLINQNIFREQEVTSDTIRGGISSFLLIGYLWYMIYQSVLFFDPNAFSKENISNFDLVYFSFTTLTTTGYGDILPVNIVAKSLANLQAIVGVIYPSVILARLVSLYSNPSS